MPTKDHAPGCYCRPCQARRTIVRRIAIRPCRTEEQTSVQRGRMLRALQALRTDVAPTNPELYAALAEGPLEEIHRLTSAMLNCRCAPCRAQLMMQEGRA